MKAAKEWHDEGIFETLGDECSREAKDGEVGASLLHSKKPVSSEEIMCIDDCLEVKELASRKDVKFFFLEGQEFFIPSQLGKYFKAQECS